MSHSRFRKEVQPNGRERIRKRVTGKCTGRRDYLQMKTQNSVLLSALNKGPVTFLQAYIKMGIGCPTSRISELRKEGHKIETRKTKVRTRWGKAVIATWVLK